MPRSIEPASPRLAAKEDASGAAPSAATPARERTAPGAADARLEDVLREFAPHIACNRLIPARPARYAPFPSGLDERLAASLRSRGITRIYTHQASTYEAARRGENVVVVTPTASGKTLCYNLPVLQTLLEDETARALYLFPTKALSQDQQAELNEVVGGNGKWEQGALLPHRIARLLAAPNLVIDGDAYIGKYEISGDPKANKRSVTAWLETLKGRDFHNPEIAEPVRINKRGIEKITSFGMSNPVYLKTLAHIPEFIENAVYLTDLQKKKEKYHYPNYKHLLLGVEMNGRPYTVRLVLGEDRGIWYYSHFITDLEKGDLIHRIRSPNADGEVPQNAHNKGNPCIHAPNVSCGVPQKTHYKEGLIQRTRAPNADGEALLTVKDTTLVEILQALFREPGVGSRESASAAGLPIKIATYDGDTPDSLRVAARDTGRIIISNPDMLHAGILPNHPKWIKFFSNLRYVVLDEAHSYRGVFGSHVANVLRRLKRVAAFYGARPRFILCSATIGNPRELAEALVEEPVTLVDNNGAPSGEKRVILYNPPLVDPVQGIRRSSLAESRRWMAALLRAGIKTILFAHSRIKTEVAASYVREDLANLNTAAAGEGGRPAQKIRVEAYRGGLLPNERHEIERGLRSGAIRGVVSTNALELGIDIGGLDASVVCGFPGSFNSFWQQSGRAGRRGGTSISVFVANASPLDQYITGEPRWFFARPPEEARLDAANPYILTDHVKCAAFELPFRDEELGKEEGNIQEGEAASAQSADEPSLQPAQARSSATSPAGESPTAFARQAADVLTFLEEDGIVRHAGGRWHWADRSFPAEGVSLRSALADNVVIVDTTKGRNNVIGEMDRPSAREMLFKNAVYIHRGAQYMVTSLDIENRKALVVESQVNYFTDGLVKTDIKVLSEDERQEVLGSLGQRTESEGPGTRDQGPENSNTVYPQEQGENNELIQGFARVARGDEFGRNGVSGNANLSENGNVWVNQPNPAGNGVGSSQYCRRQWAADNEGISIFPFDSKRLSWGTGDTPSLIGKARISLSGESEPGSRETPKGRQAVTGIKDLAGGAQTLTGGYEEGKQEGRDQVTGTRDQLRGVGTSGVPEQSPGSTIGIHNATLVPGPRSPVPAEASPLCSPAISTRPLLTTVLGDVLVRTQVTRFKKLRFHTHENIGYGDIASGAEETQTRALVLLFPPQSAGGAALAACADDEEAASCLRGAGSLLKRIAPVFLLCDERDLGLAERVRDPHFGIPALYIYDRYPGGTGLSEALAAKVTLLFPTLLAAVERCPCKGGCPSCVGPGNNKAGALSFLAALASGKPPC